MQRLKILGLALIAAFALGAVVSAAASAEVKVLPEEAVTFKGLTAKTTTLEKLNGKNVTCGETHAEGEIEAKKPLGLFHIHFLKCKGLGLLPCTGLGDKEEQILVLGTFHLVFDTLVAGNLTQAGVGVLFLLEHVHFTCGGLILVLVLGEVLCLIKPVNIKAKKSTIACEQNKGDPGEIVYWNEAGTEVKMGLNALLASEDDKTYEMAGELGEGEIETAKEVEIMT